MRSLKVCVEAAIGCITGWHAPSRRPCMQDTSTGTSSNSTTSSGSPSTGATTQQPSPTNAPQPGEQQQQQAAEDKDFSTWAAQLTAEVVASPIFYLVAGAAAQQQLWYILRAATHHLYTVSLLSPGFDTTQLVTSPYHQTTAACPTHLHHHIPAMSHHTPSLTPARPPSKPPSPFPPHPYNPPSPPPHTAPHLAPLPPTPASSGLLAIKLVASTGESALPIFLFAAAPITLLTALSKSSLGTQVRRVASISHGWQIQKQLLFIQGDMASSPGWQTEKQQLFIV